jgi:hypothetical protein
MQSFENESDFWKILGCFRSRLQDFSHIFCPGKLQSEHLKSFPTLIFDLVKPLRDLRLEH